MRKFLVHWLIAAIALYVAVKLVPGITYDGNWETLAGMAIIVGLVNAIVRPILAVLTCPLQLLTLGLFSLVLNAAMLQLAARVGQSMKVGFAVQGFGAAFLGALIVSVVSMVMQALLGSEEQGHR